MRKDREPQAPTVGVRCSFCGKRPSDPKAIVCGPTPAIAICHECVELCAEILAEQSGE